MKGGFSNLVVKQWLIFGSHAEDADVCIKLTVSCSLYIID